MFGERACEIFFEADLQIYLVFWKYQQIEGQTTEKSEIKKHVNELTDEIKALL